MNYKIKIPKHKCNKCGVELNSVQSFDNSQTNIHVCYPKDIESYKADWKNFIKTTIQKQADILKLKDIDENQLNKGMDI